jgi:MFS family permease
MQSLIHGNFEGAARKKAYALVGASAAIAAAVGPLLGGFVTTYLSWRVGFLLEDVIILGVLCGIRLVKDVPYTGSRQVDWVGAVLSVVGMGGLVLGILVWQEGGEFVGLLLAVGAIGLALLAWWVRRRKRSGKVALLDPELFTFPHFKLGVSGQLLQQVTLGGAMIVLPIFLQMTLEYNAMEAGLSLAPLSLSMFAVAMLASRRAGKRRPAWIVTLGFALSTAGMVAIVPLVPRIDSGWWLVAPLIVAGCGLGMLVSQLNNYTLSRSRRSASARRPASTPPPARSGSRSAWRWPAGSCSPSVLLVHPPDRGQLGHPRAAAAADRGHARGRRPGDEQLPARRAAADRPEGGPGGDPEHQRQGERPVAPGRAARADPRRLLGVLNGVRMRRLPDPKPSEAAEGLALG